MPTTNPKTLYISDLDGTLLNEQAQLSHQSADKLNALIAQGVNFTVATARTAGSSLKILEDVKLTLPVILMNGVLVYDVSQRRHLRICYIEPDTVLAVLDVLDGTDASALMYDMRDDELTVIYQSLDSDIMRDFVEERKVKYYKCFKQSRFCDVPLDRIIYFTFLDTYERIAPVKEALSKLPGLKFAMYRDVYSETAWYLEVFSDKASKYNGALFLREELGYERLVCFGDNLNDLPLFEACDVRVAVENAKPELKSAADYICASNLEDGVPEWIKADINKA